MSSYIQQGKCLGISYPKAVVDFGRSDFFIFDCIALVLVNGCIPTTSLLDCIALVLVNGCIPTTSLLDCIALVLVNGCIAKALATSLPVPQMCGQMPVPHMCGQMKLAPSGVALQVLSVARHRRH